MTRALRTAAAICSAVALAACGDDGANPPGLLLSEPSAVAVFRGVTSKHADARHPYLAVANAGRDDLTLIDAVDDSIVPAPVPVRTLVVPVPGRPALLASADLGDDKPDLLVAVSSGDSRLQVVRTWTAVNAVVDELEVDLGADVLAITAVPSVPIPPVPSDPPVPGRARIAAALVNRQIAIVEFTRQADGDAIERLGTPQVAQFAFQPIALAALPDDPAVDGLQTKLYAASLEPIATDISGAPISGVAEIDVPAVGPPALLQPLDAGAATRLVTAARLLRGENVGATSLDGSAFAGPAVERAYAVLDESGCGLAAPIACGLVALDPLAGGLAADPFDPLLDRAPLPIPGQALAIAAAGPPEIPDPSFAATTLVRVVTSVGTRATTGVAAVASTDGSVYFVDLGRWELPSEQLVVPNVGATVSSEAALAAPVTTAGFTPTARWTITYQGALPGLSSRRAHAPGGGPLLALQVPGAGGAFSEVVRLYDPTLGVHLGDRVSIEPTGLPGCPGTFEAEVDDFVAPVTTSFPGGAVLLRPVASGPAEWAACVGALAAGSTQLRASFLSGAYALVQGTGSTALHVGRPEPGAAFDVAWSDEAALAASCNLPPAVPWSSPPAACDATCRAACEALVRARLARRIGYVSEAGAPATGPALRFTLAPETAAPSRGLTVTIETREGRSPFRVGPPASPAVEPSSMTTFDRSRELPEKGVRFFVPYAGGAVLDATPTVQGGDPVVVR